MLLRKPLDRALQQSSQDELEAPIHATFESSGPSQLDTIALFFEGAKNPFIAYHASLNTQNAPKKIILSDKLFSSSPVIDDTLRQIMNAATCYYEVTLWRGKEVAFADLKPIQNALEFWQQSHLMVVDHREIIQECLRNQGYALDDFIILDAEAIFALREKFAPKSNWDIAKEKRNNFDKIQDTIKKHFEFAAPFDFKRMQEVGQQYDCLSERTIIIKHPTRECLQFLQKNQKIGNIHFGVQSQAEIDYIIQYLGDNTHLKQVSIACTKGIENNINELNLSDSFCEKLTIHRSIPESAKVRISEARGPNKRRLISLALDSCEATIGTNHIQSLHINICLTTDPLWLENFRAKNQHVLWTLKSLQITTNSYREIRRSTPYEVLLYKIAESAPQLESLSLGNIQIDSSRIKPFSHVRSLSFECTKEEYSDEDIDKIKTFFPNVKELSISYVSRKKSMHARIQTLFNYWPLERLELYRANFEETTDLLRRQNSSIKHLKLNQCMFAKKNTLDLFMPELKTLAHVDKDHVYPVTIDCSQLACIESIQANASAVIVGEKNTRLKTVTIDTYEFVRPQHHARSLPSKAITLSPKLLTTSPYQTLGGTPSIFNLEHLVIEAPQMVTFNYWDAFELVNPHLLETLEIRLGTIHTLDLRKCVNLRSLVIDQVLLQSVYLPNSNKLEQLIFHPERLEQQIFTSEPLVLNKVQVKNMEVLRNHSKLRVLTWHSSTTPFDDCTTQKLSYPCLEKLDLDADKKIINATLANLDAPKLNEVTLNIRCNQDSSSLTLPNQVAEYVIKSSKRIYNIEGGAQARAIRIDIKNNDQATLTLSNHVNLAELHVKGYQEFYISKSTIIDCTLESQVGTSNYVRLDSSSVKNMTLKVNNPLSIFLDYSNVNCLHLMNPNPTATLKGYHRSCIVTFKHHEKTQILLEEESTLEIKRYDTIMPTPKTATPSSTRSIEPIKLAKLARSVSLIKSTKPDSDTANPLTLITSGPYVTDLYCHPTVPANYFRIQVARRFIYDAKSGSLELDFTPKRDKLIPLKNITIRTIEKDTLSKLRDKVDQNHQYVLSYLKGTFQKNEPIPVTSESPIASDKHICTIFSNYPALLTNKFFYENEQSQVYFCCDKTTPSDMTILVVYEKGLKPTNVLGMSDDLRKAIELRMAKLDKNEPLYALHQDMIKNDIPAQVKSRKLVHYFDNTYTQVKTSSPAKNPLDKLFDSMRTRQGVCRHQSDGACLMHDYYGIPWAEARSSIHAYIEIASYVTDTEAHWSFKNLGGGQALIQMDVDAKESPFHAEPPQSQPKQQASSLASNSSHSAQIVPSTPYAQNASALFVKPKPSLEQEYRSIINRLLATKPITRLEELQGSTLPPLLLQDNIEECETIVKQLCAQDVLQQSPLYIHNPSEFHTYFKTSEITKDGEHREIPGELAETIKAGGKILINWSTFSPGDLASYQSIIDAKPRIFGVSTANVKVMGFALENGSHRQCESFGSRNQRMKLNITKEQTTRGMTFASSSATSNRVTIDCFGLPNWRRIIGDVLLHGDRYELKEGPLLIALKQGATSITFLNPPKNSGFDAFYFRLCNTRKFTFNKVKYKIPDHCEISKTSFSSAKEHPSVHFEANKTPPTTKTPIYISVQEWHTLYSEILYQGDRGYTKPGLLQSYNPNTHYFLIYGNLPLALWQEMIAFVQENLPKVPHEFYLSQGANITQLTNTPQPQEQITELPIDACIASSESRVIVSNDPDCYVDLLKKRSPKAEIVPITPNTTIADITFKATKISKENESPRFLTVTHKALLELISGNTVIITGTMSLDLYQALLPILMGHKLFRTNGKEEIIKGRLIVTLPTHCLNYLTIPAMNQYHFAKEDYAPLLPEGDRPILQKIIAFYEMANLMPLTGVGRPPHMELHYFHALTLIESFKLNLHPHNPIKNAFHYDFPKQSVEYAYLAVAAKWLFAANDQSAPNKKRLIKLLQHTSEKELDKYLASEPWRVLNCFRGSDLRSILGDDWHTIIVKSPMPTLKPLANQKLIAAVKKIMVVEEEQNDIALQSSSRATSLATRSNKQLRTKERLEQVLFSKKIRMILLKGDPGTGKSYMLDDLKTLYRIPFFDFETEFETWKKTPPCGKPIVLAIDEINLHKPGMLDHLKCILYTLSEDHKIVGTGNQESFPGRFFHDLLRDLAATIYFPNQSTEFLQQIAQSQLEPCHFLKEEWIAKKLVSIYQLTRKYNISHQYSLRDLMSLTERFLLLRKDCPSDRTSLYLATQSEFSGNFTDLIAKDRFMSEVCTLLKIKQELIQNILQDLESTEATTINGLFFPKEMAILIQSVREDLKMRDEVIATQTPGYYKKCVMVEGEVGIGKSTVMEALLVEHQLKPLEKDQTPNANNYTVLNVTSEKSLSEAQNQELQQSIKHMSKHGMIPLLDELNLNKSLEKCINPLLAPTNKSKSDNQEKDDQKTSSKDEPEDSSEKTPSQEEIKAQPFMLFTTQNPGAIGRDAQSSAVRNRMHVHIVPPISEKSMIAMATHQQLEDPELYVRVFLAIQRENDDANMRTFQEGMKEAKRLQSLRTQPKV